MIQRLRVEELGVANDGVIWHEKAGVRDYGKLRIQ